MIVDLCRVILNRNTTFAWYNKAKARKVVRVLSTKQNRKGSNYDCTGNASLEDPSYFL
jgi:hypothetical protein